jgi:hypothetical protein
MEGLYARGGGKTHGTLGDFWIHAELYQNRAIGLLIRKNREDLKDTIATGEQMYGRAARYMEKGNFFKFHNGARLYCAYLENEADAGHYQGWSLTRVYIEELTQFHSPEPVLRLLATLRSAHGVPARMKCTCNPGGPGHMWVKSWVIDHGPWQIVYGDDDTSITRVYIPARIQDNPALLLADPSYIDKLRGVGSPQLVKAWLEGDWSIVEGAFFPEFDKARHVIAPFKIPSHWMKFRSMDWGSAKPFSVGWWAVVQETCVQGGVVLPRGALIRYREWYGCEPRKADVGLKMTAEQVARGIVLREMGGVTEDPGDHPGRALEGQAQATSVREKIEYGIIDPAAFAVVSGPSIGETLARHGCVFRRADTQRVSHDKRMGGWDQLRARLVGDVEGRAMIFFFSHCHAVLRTLPIMQHDEHNLEDLDTSSEDHAVDEVRYACMSRPYVRSVETVQSSSPFLVANAFRHHEL